MSSQRTAGAVFALVGLVITAIGAARAAKGVIISDADATALASTKFDLNVDLKNNLLRQSSLAQSGLWLVLTGTLLQAMGTLMSLWWD
jgi:hypothetical protein